MPAAMRVLLIEDDPMIGRGLVRALGDAGFVADWVRDGLEAEAALALDDHALVLLDLGLPHLDGLTLLETLRRRGARVPLLVITARDDLGSRVRALDIGADDYVIKPFETAELLARIRAVSRRHVGQVSSVIETDTLRLDLATRSVTYDGTTISLPPREFALMRALVERPGTILSRAQLEEKLYGWGEEVQSNAIEVLIHYIRKRFDHAIIQNVRGAGWTVMKHR